MIRDRFSGDSVDSESVDELVELGKTTPLVSRFSTISVTVGAVLVRMTSAEMDPLMIVSPKLKPRLETQWRRRLTR